MAKGPNDLTECRALVVDPAPTSRSVLAAQMRDLGIATVVQCGRAQDARKLLEVRPFDVVLCEMEFPSDAGSAAFSGQELLDELRRENLLPLATVFVMVTGERSYAKVAEAAEAALDSYLIKPFAARVLMERIIEARHRKAALEDVFLAIEQGDLAGAAELCVRRFEARARYWIYAARLGSELLLRLARHADAKRLLDAVVATQALPWARLGLARVQLDQQQTGPALRTLEALIATEPGYADAYDVMGRAQVMQGNFADALATYRSAAALTPGAVRRQQTLGMLAFYNGDHETAASALERACMLGQGSKMFDMQTLVLLSVTRFRDKDAKALRRCLTDLDNAIERAPDSARLRRLRAVVHVFDLMLQRQVGRVVDELRRMADEVTAPSFDVEAACNLVLAVAQLTGAELNLPGADDWVRTLAWRFCGTRAVSELLARAAQAHAPYAEQVRQVHTAVQKTAETAMTHSISGDPAAAVQALLEHGRKTLNQKFVDTAQGVLQRHGATIADAARLGEELAALRARLGGDVHQQLLGQQAQAGGIRIRENSPAASSAAAAAPGTAAPALAAT
jgi:CheY-like chemotaxis protein